MEYTVLKLAQMAGVSTRTLRYYDEIGILKPARINSSGYRIYGQLEVNRLQQILFYRELGVSLESIKEIVTAPSFDGARALQEHREKLLEKREQLDLLIVTQMYVDDPRFTAYYDEKQPGTAAFLRDAVLIYTGRKV